MKEAFSRLAKSFLLIGLVTGALFPSFTSASEDHLWRKVDEGLFVGEFDLPTTLGVRDSKMTIVKIDPNLYTFKLLCASEHGRVKRTARKWCERFSLVAALNASMFQQDGLTSVGLMKNFNHFNNPKLNKAYQAVLAFNPSEPGIPEIQIIDLRCQDFERIGPKYQTLIQNIRMISCRQENVWVRKDPHWGMAVFAMDRSGKALLIFVEAPCSGHDLANALLSSPLSIFNALYLEGGREATLYFSWNGVEFERMGLRDATLPQDSWRATPQPIPNVVGISKKGQK